MSTSVESLPQRLSLKLPLESTVGDSSEVSVPPAVWVETFHQWIQEPPVSVMLIDLHDYSHVGHGPGVILVGHEAHFHMDTTDGTLGVRTVFKRGLTGDLPARLQRLWHTTAQAALALEGALSARSIQARFDPRRWVLHIDDRLHAPNTDATFERLAPTVQGLVPRWLGADLSLTRVADDRATFGLIIDSPEANALSDIAARLS